MPAPETSDLIHRAVLWPAIGGYDRYGKPKVGNPIEIPCRWRMQRRQSVDQAGNPIALEATVQVDQVVPLNSRMWKGLLTNWDDTRETEILYVRTYKEDDDLKGCFTAREVGLSKYKEDMPTQS